MAQYPVCGNSGERAGRKDRLAAYLALLGSRSEQRITTSGEAKRGKDKEKVLGFMGIGVWVG